MQLRGRVAVITGADSAAGDGMARALASEGMSLMLIARPGAQVRTLAEELSAAHDIRCFPASLDVTDPAAVDRIVMHAEQHIGTVDVLVNTVPGRMTDALLPTMQQRGRGHIVNLDQAPETAAPPPIRVSNLQQQGPAPAAHTVVTALFEGP